MSRSPTHSFQPLNGCDTAQNERKTNNGIECMRAYISCLEHLFHKLILRRKENVLLQNTVLQLNSILDYTCGVLSGFLLPDVFSGLHLALNCSMSTSSCQQTWQSLHVSLCSICTFAGAIYFIHVTYIIILHRPI